MTDNRSEPAVRHPRFLVLAHAGDTGAVQVAAALERRHGTGQVALVSDTALAQANWLHHLDASGTESRVVLGDGRILTHDGFSLVCNRLHAVFPHRFVGADEVDREYAQAETNALLLSWLAGFPCPVVPEPAPPSLSPMFSSLPGLLASASRSGLPVRRFSFCSNARLAQTDDAALAFSGDTDPSVAVATEPTPRYLLGRDPALYLEPVAGTPRRLLVVGTDVLGSVPDGLGPACVRFASACGCDVLTLLFDRRQSSATDADSRWCLCAADPQPALDSWEEAVAVARYLDRRAAQNRALHGHVV